MLDFELTAMQCKHIITSLFTGALLYLVVSRRPRSDDDAPYPAVDDEKTLSSAASSASRGWQA